MRVSSSQIFNIARIGMSDANQAMMKTQEQMSTGKRVLTPSDDPVAATKILQVTDELKAIEQYQKNIDIAQNNLSLEESILGGVNNIIQRMQELAVAAGNTASLTPNEYRSMAAEVDERLKELMGLLNTKNANGDHIFGGYKSSQPPFSGDTATGFRYHGDDGQQFIQVGHNTRIAASDSGKELFMDVPSAQNTVQTSTSPANRSNPPIQVSVGQVLDQKTFDEFYPKDMVITFNQDNAIDPAGKNFTVTERASGRVVLANEPFISGQPIEINGVGIRITGNPASATADQPGDRVLVESSNKQDVLSTMARFQQAMANYENTPEGREQLSGVIANTLDGLGKAHDSSLEVITKIGARMNTLESARDMHLDAKLFNEEVLSQLQSVDYAEAATRLSQQSMILQAAQQSFLRVSQLTLFARM